MRSFFLFIESTSCKQLRNTEKTKIAYFARSICASEPIYSFVHPTIISTLQNINNSNSTDYRSSLLQPHCWIIGNCLYNMPFEWPSWMFKLLNLIGNIAQTIVNDIKDSQKVNNQLPTYLPSNENEKQTMRDFLHHGTHFAAEYQNVRPRFESEVQNEKKTVASKDNIHCVKHFKQTLDKPGSMIFRCANHGVGIGHYLFAKGEGLNDVFLTIFCFWPSDQWIDIGLYDYNCGALGYIGRRCFERYAYKICENILIQFFNLLLLFCTRAQEMIAKLDIKHGRGHKSCVSFLMDELKAEFPDWRRLQDQCCEQNNPNVNTIRIKGLYSRTETFMLIMSLRLDVESRKKLQKYCPNGIQRQIRDEEKRNVGEPPRWYKLCFSNDDEKDDLMENNSNNNINLIPIENYSSAESYNDCDNSESNDNDDNSVDEQLEEIDALLDLSSIWTYDSC